ncbi:MAG: glycosyltransferase family 39 protein [Alphaproteobacteria bacterium]|nr:glycosyltransferase family 39 protein [Alphaproteobacteria bacterium]
MLNDLRIENAAGEPVDGPAVSYAAYAAYAIAALTAARLLWLAVQTAGLYPDEAQYWLWSRHLAFGYYSKPPLVAWTIALTTSLAGNSEFGVRLAAPLLHATAAAFVYALAARLYDRRVGCWAALAYATLPGVSLSAYVISTDAVLLPCWAAALYAFVRARDGGGARWWVATGAAVGIGLLGKYAMAYWAISAVGFTALYRKERRHLPGVGLALAVAALFCLPNLWWNYRHGFATYLHVRDNAGLHGSLFHPIALVEFVVSQLGVFGPFFFVAAAALCVAPARFAGRNGPFLAAFTWPALAIVSVESLLSRAQPNWAATAYVSAVVLLTTAALRHGWRWALAGSIALHVAVAAILFAGSETIVATRLAVPAKLDPLHRLRGWQALGAGVGAALAQHPDLRLMADDRETLAALVYYVRPHPFDAVAWDPIPGISNQWDLDNNLHRHGGESFLAVTIHGLEDYMRRDFASFDRLETIDIASGPGGGRRYTLYIARDYRGG